MRGKQFYIGMLVGSALTSSFIAMQTSFQRANPPDVATDYFRLQEQFAPKHRTRRIISKEERKVVSLDLSRASTSDTINYESISEKWQMPEGAIAILKEIQSKPVAFDYNRETDILAFRHPLKTGGTSFSLTLADRFGRGRVLPGSGKSDWFKFHLYEEALEKHPPANDTQYWDNIAVLYTHTLLRAGKMIRSTKNNDLLKKLREDIPSFRKKRFRLMTNVRKPIDLAASSFYETKCRIGTYSGARDVANTTECPEVDLKAIVSTMRKEAEECKAGTRELRCKWIQKKTESFFKMCSSIDNLLDSGLANNQHFNTLMGDLPTPPDVKGSKTPTMQDVALYTLRDLGGLVDVSEKHKEDFVWFAITERMTESLCLFYYKFKIEPKEKESRALYKKCRPINLWEDRHKRRHEAENDFDYTVWRAANAIMDVRMEDMRLEIKGRLASGERLEDIPFLGKGCYADTNGAFESNYVERKARKKGKSMKARMRRY